MIGGMDYSTDGKVRENRLRDAARRQGKRLFKSRARDPLAVGFGRWVLRPAGSRTRPKPAEYVLTVDEVEAELFPARLDRTRSA